MVSFLIVFIKKKGALTSKPFAFKGRSWEIRSLFGIDLSDALLSNLRIDIRGTEVLRILPQVNEIVNLEWISDRARYFYDSLFSQRLVHACLNIQLRSIKGLVLISWLKLFFLLKKVLQKGLSTKNWFLRTAKVNSKQFYFGCSNSLLDIKSMEMVFFVFSCLGIKLPFLEEENFPLGIDFRSYLVSNIQLEAYTKDDLFIVIGSNLRLENPIFSYKIEQLVKKNKNKSFFLGAKAGSINSQLMDSTSIKAFLKLIQGRHSLNSFICNKNRTFVLIGNSFIIRKDSAVVLKTLLYQISSIKMKERLSFGILPLWANSVSFAELGGNILKNFSEEISLSKKLKVIWLFGDVERIKSKSNATTFVIYQGSHNREFMDSFDIMIPVLTPYEKESYFINCDGLFQKMNVRIKSSVNFSDAIILKHFMEFYGFGKDLLYSSFKNINKLGVLISAYDLNISKRNRYSDTLELITFTKSIKGFSEVIKYDFIFLDFFSQVRGRVFNSFLNKSFNDFFLVNSLTRISKILAIASRVSVKNKFYY